MNSKWGCTSGMGGWGGGRPGGTVCITDASSKNEDTWFTSTCMSIHCHMNVVTRTHSHAYTANYLWIHAFCV
jgi:hypothetical protein